ncbi:ADP-ribosylglycohydrolase family protein [Gryllotalpicola koreensis]|uniref:ADP-ribosylglycohydrolase family protein n=1 Tax=Gryllotalpicola koreensis TaxID=993086 RepID=A0ABP7ZT49_9MICO
MLTPQQLDRAVGAVTASAAGDALGAPYEFHASVLPPTPITLHAAPPWELGEWTDDTSMAVPILQALARHKPLDDARTLAAIVGEWIGWARDAKDVGLQTRAVLAGIRHVTEDDARTSALAVHRKSGKSAGNGSLMRTGPVALGFLGRSEGGETDALAAAARRVSELTHHETDAGDACVIWSLAIRSAILTGALELRAAVSALPVDRAALWNARLDAAEAALPWELHANNGWVVGALQCAWSAIVHASSLRETLELAVRSGNDTDTVAAIAGSLAGAVYGAAAVPAEWVEVLHGWPADEFRAFGAAELAELVHRAVSDR